MRQHIAIGFVEQNPLAVPYLRQLLRRHFFPVHCQKKLFAGSIPPGRQPAVVVVDKGALHTSLHTCIWQVAERFPTARILAIGNEASQNEMLGLLAQGVHGFLSYQEVGRQITRAIKAVLKGKLRFPSGVLEQYSLAEQRSPRGLALLTRRERVLLELLEQGLANKQAASALHVSQNTIKFHLSNIYRKLEVHDRRSAVKIANAGNTERFHR